MAKKIADEISDEETEARANEALRRALTTPYKPQSELKKGREPKKKAAPKKTPAKP